MSHIDLTRYLKDEDKDWLARYSIPDSPKARPVLAPVPVETEDERRHRHAAEHLDRREKSGSLDFWSVTRLNRKDLRGIIKVAQKQGLAITVKLEDELARRNHERWTTFPLYAFCAFLGVVLVSCVVIGALMPSAPAGPPPPPPPPTQQDKICAAYLQVWNQPPPNDPAKLLQIADIQADWVRDCSH